MVNLFRSRLLDEKHPLRQMAFKVLFADKAGMREVPIKNLRTKRGMGLQKQLSVEEIILVINHE